MRVKSLAIIFIPVANEGKRQTQHQGWGGSAEAGKTAIKVATIVIRGEASAMTARIYPSHGKLDTVQHCVRRSGDGIGFGKQARDWSTSPRASLPSVLILTSGVQISSDKTSDLLDQGAYENGRGIWIGAGVIINHKKRMRL
ncbi:hypothetical protein K440DRAFT_304469 [Wilcoxina mikolae CBS 423.85]|nr:hypothetical protein K440DRAFT_304469 [Wilcoxina mikolae CBS 423.85]